jgi:hypothetical protein
MNIDTVITLTLLAAAVVSVAAVGLVLRHYTVPPQR